MMRRLAVLWLAGMGMMTATGCTASEAPMPEPLCRVEGDTKLLPTMTKADICGRFVEALDAALASMDGPSHSRAGWHFALRFVPPGEAIALMSHSDAAHAVDVQISVSDRPLGDYVVGQLGDAAARRIAASSINVSAR